MPGATPPSEVLSDPATRSEWLVHEHAVCKIEVSHLCCVRTCRGQLRACCTRVRVCEWERVRQERRLTWGVFLP